MDSVDPMVWMPMSDPKTRAFYNVFNSMYGGLHKNAEHWKTDNLIVVLLQLNLDWFEYFCDIISDSNH